MLPKGEEHSVCAGVFKNFYFLNRKTAKPTPEIKRIAAIILYGRINYKHVWVQSRAFNDILGRGHSPRLLLDTHYKLYIYRSFENHRNHRCDNKHSLHLRIKRYFYLKNQLFPQRSDFRFAYRAGPYSLEFHCLTMFLNVPRFLCG